jgi:hypothetical protein
MEEGSISLIVNTVYVEADWGPGSTMSLLSARRLQFYEMMNVEQIPRGEIKVGIKPEQIRRVSKGRLASSKPAHNPRYF